MPIIDKWIVGWETTLSKITSHSSMQSLALHWYDYDNIGHNQNLAQLLINTHNDQN